MSELTFKQVLPFITADLKAGQTPALLGRPGIGKSSITESLARIFKTKVFTLPVNQLADRADLTGVRMTQSTSGAWRQEAFPHSLIMECIEYAQANPSEHPILFLDEFNRASSDITSSILSFQTLRRIGTIDFPDNLRMMVAGNDKGNVTSLDEASVSRFSVYHVKPDLETFLQVQVLNPFVREVLAKYPDDLMATEVVDNVESGDSDEDDNDDEMNFAQFEFHDGDSFAQITVPRTVTYTSEWLDALGIDKSGTDDEKEALTNLFTDIGTEGQNTLLIGIQAHVGKTTFAYHLFDEINMHFNTMLSSGHTSSQPVLQDLRPSQDIINVLSRATGLDEVETLIESTDKKVLVNTLIWLTENESVKEIDNNRAVEDYMTNALHNIDSFDNKAISSLMKVLPESSRVSKVAVNAMLSSSAPVMNNWRAMIQSVMETD